MTWALHNHTPRAERPAPQLDLLRLLWKMQAPSGKVLSCGLYRSAAGMEVRCGYSDDDPLRTQFTRDLATADAVAGDWKATALAKGFVEAEEA